MLCKQGVTGSIPVTSTILIPGTVCRPCLTLPEAWANATPQLRELWISRRSALERVPLASMNFISRTEKLKGTTLMLPGTP
jgi:hypothetical protein